MIKIIQDMPVGTIGLEAVGKVTEEDYQSVLLPAISSAVERTDVRLLYVLGDDFDSYSPGAVWADQAVGGTPPSLEKGGHRLRRRLVGERHQGVRLAYAGRGQSIRNRRLG